MPNLILISFLQEHSLGARLTSERTSLSKVTALSFRLKERPDSCLTLSLGYFLFILAPERAPRGLLEGMSSCSAAAKVCFTH